MKEISLGASVLTTFIFGPGISEFFALHPWTLVVLIIMVLTFLYFFFRKPPAAPST